MVIWHLSRETLPFYYSRTVWALLTILSVISLNFLQASRTLNNSEC